ncbi:unnamed protein product [Didymodactylos carnosus]|uniref:Uncharacterized protein n=1 Tax=Didymodactylos carnosus TaxID=1234261 RepID=A0A814WNZ7_9BILA|nr:unnamed protein product [Didymodactylos carnosus]CAF1328320.1 unnamed protein product [Didymodactylos carnosus]CAF3968604.1 unnamed protein product [Didymodactylos carnosus]CAF4139672.1 unnamed protein product [Didymodactylos carnosus]
MYLGCEYVMAVASPFSFHEEIQPKRDLVDPTIAALIHLLETAVATPSVKRVIITGSQATVFNYDYGPSRDYMYTEKDWNPVTYEQACNPPQDIYCGPLIYAYAGGKTLAEKAAWEFTRNNAQEKFDIVCILPSWIFDPTTWQPTSSADFSESNKIIYGLYQGQAPPSDIFPHWVDVRDVARAHVLAIEKRNAGGYRLIVNSGPFRVRDAIVSLKKLESRVVDPEHVKNLDKWCGMDNGKSVELLGMKYIGLDQCFTDMVEQFKKMTA